MREIIKLIIKSITRAILNRVIKDLLAGNQIAKHILKEIPDDEKGIVRACKKIGMSDIQTIGFITILGEEVGNNEEEIMKRFYK